MASLKSLLAPAANPLAVAWHYYTAYASSSSKTSGSVMASVQPLIVPPGKTMEEPCVFGTVAGSFIRKDCLTSFTVFAHFIQKSLWKHRDYITALGHFHQQSLWKHREYITALGRFHQQSLWNHYDFITVFGHFLQPSLLKHYDFITVFGHFYKQSLMKHHDNISISG